MRIIKLKKIIIFILIIRAMVIITGCARWTDEEPEPGEADYRLEITVEVSGIIDSYNGIYYIVMDADGNAATGPEYDVSFWDDRFYYIKLEDGKVNILTSQRSSIVSRLDVITNSIEAIARLAGGEGVSGDGYPPWQPNMDSLLLAKSVKLYEKMYDKKPVVEVIHAGLECGIIGDKYPGMDMISIGPTLKYPHSPDEKIHVGTVGKVWDFIAELLKELA